MPDAHGYNTDTDTLGGALDEATDAELDDAKIGVVTDDGMEQRSAKEVIRLLDGVIPGELTLLPTPNADAKYLAAIDNQEGKIRVLKEHANQQTTHTGTFTNFSTALFLGVHITDPTGTVENQFYYNRLTQTFRSYIMHNHVLAWRNATPNLLHTGTVVWLGVRNNDNAALNHINNFSSSNHYYYYNRNTRRIRHLTNSTYAAGTTVNYQYEWISIGLSEEQYQEVIRAHETRPWTHSERLRYITTFGGTGIEFRFTTVSSVDYLEFSSLIDGTVAEDWLKTWEKHDEFAIVTVTEKDEVFHAEVDGDYDETDRRIPVIDLPDPLGLTNDTDYLIEATRAAPDIGQELPRIREEVLEGIEPFAQAKRISSSPSNFGEFIDKTSKDPIPRDRRFANLPLPWRSEYLNARAYQSGDLSSAGASTGLVFSVVDESSNRYIRFNDEAGGADHADMESMKKHDVLVVEGTNGDDDGVILAMFVAVEDWDGTNGLQVDTIFFDSSNDHFDFDNEDFPCNVYMTGAEAEVPDGGAGGSQGTGITDLARTLVLRSNGNREWLDVLANPQWDEIYKAGTTTTDYTESIGSTGNYSVKSGYDFRDYGDIAILIGSSSWGRAALVTYPRELFYEFTEGVNAFGDPDTPMGEGRIEYFGSGSAYIRLRLISNTQFNINAINGLNIRAIFGKRQGDS